MKVLLLIVTAAALADCRAVENGLVRLALHKAESFAKRLETLDKPVRSFLNYTLKRGSKPVVIPLTDLYLHEYYATVGVGTPAQKFNIMFDTSWWHLALPSSKCGDLPCVLHSRFDSSKSSTHQETNETMLLSGGEGVLAGLIGRDTITVGSLTVKDQGLGEMLHEPYQMLYYHSDGILGLAYPTNSQLDTQTPFLTSLINRKLIPQPIFSTYFNRSSDGESGELVFGGSNSQRYQGDFTYVPTLYPGTWIVKVDSIALGSASFCAMGCRAVVSIDEPFLTGPTLDIARINAQIGAKPFTDAPGGMYTIDCAKAKSLPTLTVQLSGHKFSLSAEQYVLKFGPPTDTCFSAFKELNVPFTPDMILLGTPFVGAFYAQFDAGQHRIGLAKLR